MRIPEPLREILLNFPAMAAPPGVKPNFVDPPNLRGHYLVTIVSTVMISTCAILVRTYTKFRIIRKVGWEDCMTIPFHPGIEA